MSKLGLNLGTKKWPVSSSQGAPSPCSPMLGLHFLYHIRPKLIECFRPMPAKETKNYAQLQPMIDQLVNKVKDIGQKGCVFPDVAEDSADLCQET